MSVAGRQHRLASIYGQSQARMVLVPWGPPE
jgi:hypothetical protein